jgi:hypothetical protein
VIGRVGSAVIRTADTARDGELLLDVDPMVLAASVNAEPYPLWDSHDPGRPQRNGSPTESVRDRRDESTGYGRVRPLWSFA